MLHRHVRQVVAVDRIDDVVVILPQRNGYGRRTARIAAEIPVAGVQIQTVLLVHGKPSGAEHNLSQCWLPRCHIKIEKEVGAELIIVYACWPLTSALE